MRRPARSSSRPLYLQVADILRERIESGEVERGTVLPAFEDLRESLDVGAHVLKRGLSELREKGWLEADGEESYRARFPKPVTGVLLNWDPAELALDVEGEISVRVHSKVMSTLPEDLLPFFELHGKEGRTACKITKVYSTSAEPVALEVVTAPNSCLPGLLMKDHRTATLFQTIERGFGFRIARVEQRTHVRTLTKEEAGLLQSTPEFPALCKDQFVETDRETVAVSRWVVPGGRCGFVQVGDTRPRASN